MAWLHVINGVSININGSHDEDRAISADSDYKDLSEEVSSVNLYVNSLVNDEDGGLSLFLGKEMLDRRHLYIGETSTLDPGLTQEEKELIEKFSKRLQEILSKPSLNLEISEPRFGIIVSVFD